MAGTSPHTEEADALNVNGLGRLLAVMQLHIATHGAETATRIVLEVHNNAEPSNESLSQAEHAVARLLATLGLSLLWSDSPETSTAPGALPVTLLSDTDAGRVPEFRPHLVLGLSAPPPLRRVRINAQRVRYAVVSYGCSEGALLGHVIGHETRADSCALRRVRSMACSTTR